MDGAGSVPGQLSHQKNFIKVLDQLEAFHDNRARRSARFRGRAVDVILASDSLLSKLKAGKARPLHKKEASDNFRHHLMVLLMDQETSKSLKSRLIEDVTKGVFPFLTKKERRTILQNKTAILRSKAERQMVEEASKTLKSGMPHLLSKMPNLTLVESRDCLKAFHTLCLMAPEKVPKRGGMEKFMVRLERHFNKTRQPDGFVDLENEVILELLHGLKHELPEEEKSEWLKKVGSTSSARRDATIRRGLQKIYDNGRRAVLSIHGHPRDLVTKADMDLLKEFDSDLSLHQKFGLSSAGLIVERLSRDVKRIEGGEEFQRLAREFEKLDIEAIWAKLAQNEALTHEEREAIASSRKLLLDIQLKQGRRWDMALLEGAELWSSLENHQAFATLLEIDKLRGHEIDQAHMQWMLSQHDSMGHHPKVVIEGAGPTGLMLAMSQFQAGADVSVFEKRSTEYNRVQVVRLDPKWMNMLKFYLGEEYYQLFGTGEGKGVVRPDGFGEIVTFRLEEALHDRLTKLIGWNTEDHIEGARQGAANRPRQLERVAAYTLTGVVEPTGPEEKYRVEARYESKYDQAGKDFGEGGMPDDFKASEDSLQREVELVICAGGKSSKMRDDNMTDQEVTASRTYGVCTWEDKSIPNKTFDTFQDFRGMVVFDGDFHEHFAEQLNSHLQAGNGGLADQLGMSAGAEKVLADALSQRRGSPLQRLKGKTRGLAMQTRCFENKGLIYIGMEVPEALKKYTDAVSQKLERAGVDKATTGSLVGAIEQAWFQAVAHSYGLDQSEFQATPKKINQKFASVFPVSQSRVKDNVVQKASPHGSELLITAAGDAAASPHFMRYSGLTGGRENILHLLEFTRKASMSDGFSAESQQELERKSRQTADFVIQRGEVFLEPQLRQRG